MKDETSGVVIGEFIGLKTNVYSFLINENSENKKAKSVNKNNFEKKLMMNTKMSFLEENIWNTQWIEFKVNKNLNNYAAFLKIQEFYFIFCYNHNRC